MNPITVNLGGKQDDVRMDSLKTILQVQYPQATVAWVVPPQCEHWADAQWIRKYPDAITIHKIWGKDPQTYVSRAKIK